MIFLSIVFSRPSRLLALRASLAIDREVSFAFLLCANTKSSFQSVAARAHTLGWCVLREMVENTTLKSEEEGGDGEKPVVDTAAEDASPGAVDDAQDSPGPAGEVKGK